MDDGIMAMDSIDYMTLEEANDAPFQTAPEMWEERARRRKLKIYEARAAGSVPSFVSTLTPTQIVDEISKPMHFRKAQCFPTKRRPQPRPLSDATSAVIDDWFSSCSVRIFEGLSPHEASRARRLLYTWREVFEADMLKIKRTDLIEHCIELTPRAAPVKSKIPLYTEEERAFCNKLLPRMEQAGLIYRCDSEWGARTKFPRKPNSPELRMVHNYIPLNRCSRKSQYPTPRIEQIVQTIYKAGKKVFFCTDAANSYWAIPLRRKDWLLTLFVTPSGQFCYGVMGQGLTGGTHTYSRYRDIVFGYIPEDVSADGQTIPGCPSLIGDLGTVSFDGMVDDSYGSATDFDTMFTFLHESFFPRCAFGPMYLKPSKSFFFFPSLEFLGLEGNLTGLRPSLKKRDQILGWPTPQCQEEVEAFLYLTPFLRRFIPGRAEHHRILSGSKDKSAPFSWTPEKEASFLAIKHAIAENAMAAVDPSLQYHLAVDASKRATGGVLFQLHGIPAGTQAGPEHRHAERILIISFKLADAESRYSNSEREALAVVRNLAEVRWMITASPYPTMVYTDHEALKTLLVGVDNDAHGRIANWQDRFGEYNVQLFHRSSKTHFMGIADGLSWLPTRLLGQHVMEDSDRPESGPQRRSGHNIGGPLLRGDGSSEAPDTCLQLSGWVSYQ
jgi:hypothetical protein